MGARIIKTFKWKTTVPKEKISEAVLEVIEKSHKKSKKKQATKKRKK